MLRLKASTSVPGCPSPCGRIGVRVKSVTYGSRSRASVSAVNGLPTHASTSRSRCMPSGNARGSIGYTTFRSENGSHPQYSQYLCSAAKSSFTSDTSDRDGSHGRPNKIATPPHPIYNKPQPFESTTSDDPTLELTPEQQKLQAALADLAYELTAAAAAAAGISPAAHSKTPQPHNAALPDGTVSKETPTTTTSSSSSGANHQNAALLAQQIKDILNDWSDKYLTPSQLPVVSEATSSHKATVPSTVIKALVDQLVQGLLRKSDDVTTPTDLEQLGVERNLVAAAAAAAIGGAGASASKPVQATHKSADQSAAGTLTPSPAPTDTFDPDVWEATAAAAAAAIDDDSQPDQPNLNSSSSGGTSGTNPTSGVTPGASPDVEAIRDTDTGTDSDRPAPSSSMCWPVELLAQAVAQAAAAAAAAVHQSPYVTPSFNPQIKSQLSATPDGAGHLTAAGRLLSKPAAAAVDDLLLLQPVDRAAVLQLLCGGNCGSRGGDWLCGVLGGVRGQLGLMEMGMMLAALHERFGSKVFRAAAQQLLPLTHPSTDPLLSLTPSHSAPLPAAALQALLLHWLLLPQLAAAGLPVLPEQQIVLLLQEVMVSCSSKQLQSACRWGEMWPLTQLAADHGSSSGSSSSAGGSTSDPSMMEQSSTEPAGAFSWQLHEPTLDASLLSNAWGGLTGISLDNVAHVNITAAAALLPEQHSSSSSGSSRHMASAASRANLTSVARALTFGFQPLQPMLLLLMHHVQKQLLLRGAASASWKQQLQQVLLEASSSTGSSLAAPSLADLIHSDLGRNGSSSSGRGESLLIAAAISLLADLEPDQLRSELLLLLDLQQQQQWAMQGYCLAKPEPGNPCTLAPNIYQVLVGLAEAANPDQAATMLEVLPMPVWSAVWAVFVGPTSGNFCWGIDGLAAALAKLAAAGRDAVGASARGSGSSSNGSSIMEKLQAAWAVVAAHFALREVQGDLKQAASTAGSDNAASKTQQQQQQWTVGPTYTYQSGVPFVGDGWDQDSSSTTPAAAAAVEATSCFNGGLSSLVDRVLVALPAAAAMHIAALVAVVPADAFARLAAHLLSPLNNYSGYDTINYSGSSYTPGPGVTSDTSDTSYTAGTPGHQHSTTTPLLRSLENNHQRVPDLPRQPLAVQLLAAVSAHLPLDQLPSFLAHSDQIISALHDLPWIAGAGPRFDLNSSDHEICVPCEPDQQRDLIIAAAAVGRDSAAVQHMLIMLVDQSAADLARAAVDVLGGGVPEAVLLEATQKLQKHNISGSSSSMMTGFEGEMVWQLGQANEVPTAAAAGYGNADHALVRRLSDIVGDIPAAVPAGSWSMDAMQDPQRIAGLLQQLLSLLSDWTPSCPAAAAAVGQLITTLITKRAWSAAEAGAVMQRIKLSTALQLLLLEGSSSNGSSSWMTRNRSKLLFAVMDWHGFDATVDAIRALFVQYGQAGVADFAVLMADLQPAVAAAAASSSSSRELHVHGVAADSPNLYIAALLHTLGLMRGMDPAGTKCPGDIPAAAAAGSSVEGLAPAWSRHLSRMLCLLAALVPDHVMSHLAEQISISLVRSGEADSILAQPAAASSSSSGGSSSNQADVPSTWQMDLGMLLADLPVAAAAVAGKGFDLWGPSAVALCSGAAAAAGGAAVLPALRVACGGSTGSSSNNSECWQGCKQVAANLPALLQQLQEQGVLTCSIGSSSSSRSTATHPGNSSTACSSNSPAASGCINLQLVLLLQQLHNTDRCIPLSTAVQALTALSPTLGKALPQALVQVFGHPKTRGYEGLNGVSVYNPDAAEALEQLEASLQATAAAVMPTVAATSTAAAVAGKQLSEVLVYCHEMISDQIMSDLITAIAAVFPWHLTTTTSSSSSRGDGPMFCPAEIWYDQDGWAGVTQTQLVTSSLLTASCAMWGVDKGTRVAHSLINKLVAAAAGAKRSADVVSAAVVDQHSSSADLQDSSSSSSGAQWQSQKAKEALLNAAASGGGSTNSTRSTTASSTATTTHAGRAEAALLRAAGVTSAAATPAATDSHARRAAAALVKAASSGAVEADDGAGTSHASLAQQKLITAALGTDGSSSSRNNSSREALFWAVSELIAAARHIDRLAQSADALNRTTVAAAASRSLVSQLLAAGYSPAPAATAGAAAAAAGSSTDGAVTATVLLEALSNIGNAALPLELVVQVLVQCEGLVSNQQWDHALAAALATAAAAELTLSRRLQQQQQLLDMLVCEVQVAVRVNARGPRIYATILAAAAAAAAKMGESKLSSKDMDSQVSPVLQPLLHLMLTGSSSTSSSDSSRGSAARTAAAHKGVALSASAAARLVLELVGSSSSSTDGTRREINSSSEDPLDLQLLLLSQVVPAMLHQYGSSSSSNTDSSSLPLFVACLVDRISIIADPMQQMYILLLLQPHLTQQQLLSAVADTSLAGSSSSSSSVDATFTAAAAALQQLCNQAGPGKSVPLASYAEILAAALDLCSSRGGSSHEAGLDQRSDHLAQQRQQQQQLMAAVAAVLGSFRGMRSLHVTNPAPTHLLLPLSDLAAVLCYTKMLLPAATADHLAAAVAAALSSDQLNKLLLLLPQAACYGFGKGSELWLPLLHIMSVAAGLTDAAEADLARKLTQVAADQAITAPVTIPCHSALSDPSTPTAAAAAAHDDTLASDRAKGPADPPTVNAAHASARATAATAAATASPTAAAAAAAIRSHPISCDDQHPQDSEQSAPTRASSRTALDALGILSLLFVGAVYCGPVAALYRAAGVCMGLSWAAANLLDGLLEESDIKGSSSSSRGSTGRNAASKGEGMPKPAAAAAGGFVACDESPPNSPRTPTVQESRAGAPTAAAADEPAITASSDTVAGSSGSSSSGSSNRSVKEDHTATPSTGATLITPDPAQLTAAAAAAAATGEAADNLASSASSNADTVSAVQHMLGSLYVDSDEAIRKISTAAGDLPLDQAMMMVVPLLLQHGSSSSSLWPLLAIDAVVRAKHPAVSLTLLNNMSALNLGSAAAIDMPRTSNTSSSSSDRSPLSSLLAAADAIRAGFAGFKTLDGSWQQHSVAGSSDLETLLTTAEAVDPWAVSMQICSRVINALWDALMGSCTTGSSSSSSSGWGYDDRGPDGAAASWQAIVTDLLKGTSKEATLRLLSKFVAHSSSSGGGGGWEAALRALAVATALQDSSNIFNTTTSSSSLGSRDQQQQSMFTVLLQDVCSSRSYPPLAFLVLLLQQQQVTLSSSDVAAVLQAALDQLLTAHGTPAAAVGAGNSNVPPASSARNSGSRAGDLLDFTDGDFDFWGFDALFKDLDLFAEPQQQQQQQQQQREGPQYQPTSQFAADGGSSSSVAAAAVPAAAMDSITAIVKAAISRGHSMEALDFIMCRLLLVDTQQQTSSGDTACLTAIQAFGSSSSVSPVKEEPDVTVPGNPRRVRGEAVDAKLVLDHDQMSVLLSLAADCCAAALPPGGSSSSMLAAALLPTAVTMRSVPTAILQFGPPWNKLMNRHQPDEPGKQYPHARRTLHTAAPELAQSTNHDCKISQMCSSPTR